MTTENFPEEQTGLTGGENESLLEFQLDRKMENKSIGDKDDPVSKLASWSRMQSTLTDCKTGSDNMSQFLTLDLHTT